MTFSEQAPLRVRLGELAALFFRLGLTAFGGPAAHTAMMEEEVVRRRQWMSAAEFLDLVGATNLIPGPNSTELAIHIGHRRAGALGLIVAGTCFILPAAAVTLGFGWAYVRFGAVPQVGGVLYGVKPVMVAVVAQALWSLGKTALKTRTLGALGSAALVVSAMGYDELLVLFATGALAAWLGGPAAGTKAPTTRECPGWNVSVLGLGSTAASWWLALTPTSIFFVFAKVGSVLFGSGYVLLAFLRTELVERRHWMTEAQLLDAIAVGQVTPGPVFTTATFIGYVLRGGAGALAATAGIFVPAFVFVAISGPLIPRIRRSVRAGAFLDGVNVASLALMAVVTARLAGAAVVDVVSLVLAVGAALALAKWKLSSLWLVFAGAIVGLVTSALR